MSDHRILLVDPFKNLVNAYRIILEEEGYAVEPAFNLSDAYELLNKGPYSVILSEYIPPFETTQEMIRSVKKSSPETYIIMVSNVFVDAKEYERLFATGLDDFILKPFTPDKILVHIRRGLRQMALIQKLQKLEKFSFLEPFGEEIQETIFNPAFFKRCLRQELRKAKRHNRPFSLLLIQLPAKEEIETHFDSFYSQLLKMIRRYTREEDMVGKNNGHIGIILPETDTIGSKALMQRLLDLIRDYPPFKANRTQKEYSQNLFFQSFTYPNDFALPESLKAVLEGIDEESLRRS